MRACFLGQNICALGNGFAIVQMTPIAERPVDGGNTTKDKDGAARKIAANDKDGAPKGR